MESNLVQKGWLKRVIEIPRINETFTYSGRGIGTEKCIIAEEEFVAQSVYGWFVPEFKFSYRGNDFNVQARVWPWPWLGLRSFSISIDGNLVYSEGKKPYKVTKITEFIHLTLWFILTFSPLLILAKLF